MSVDAVSHPSDLMILLFVLFITIVPLVAWSVFRMLPSRRLPMLRGALEELDVLYYFSLESGLLDDITTIYFRSELLMAHDRAEHLHARVLQSVTIRDELVSLFRGLSSEIDDLRQVVDEVCAHLTALSHETLQEQRYRAPHTVVDEKVVGAFAI